MKGATIGHSKQRVRNGRYIGITEPGIIAAESPNPIVNELVIMPDIEKRLEAFVRLGHAVIVFPGGVGTVEEILFLLGVLTHPENADVPFPMILAGPESSRAYFEQIDEFIGATLGDIARARYEIILGDPAAVARRVRDGVDAVKAFRQAAHDAYFYSWRLKIDRSFQAPFVPTHEAMQQLRISPELRPDVLAANLRCAFSGLVAGNVRHDGISRIAEHGPFEIAGDARLMARLDKLLKIFVSQRRMRLPGREYVPCYRILT
jgi:predicted Rossmann-fold nucleotide-binding protein